ncbi:hypothetical protein F5887DRAFT_919351 [Amanita rubescens]|nr:hypothetical protein F5887DRAFT_919351 [Amanita rubescens]
MFFSYALLLFLLGTSVTARPLDPTVHLTHSLKRVKISVSGMNIQNGHTLWYRLEPPKDHQDRDKDHRNDVAQINTDGFVVFDGFGFPSWNVNLRRMVGVWGAVPNGKMSSEERNRELSCQMTRPWSTKKIEESGEVKCQVIEAKASGTVVSTSPHVGADKWYRIKPGKSGGDMNDVFWAFSSNGPPRHQVLESNGNIGPSNLAQKGVEMERRRDLLIITKHEEVQTRKSLTGKTKVAKQYKFFGPVKTQQDLRAFTSDLATFGPRAGLSGVP